MTRVTGHTLVAAPLRFGLTAAFLGNAVIKASNSSKKTPAKTCHFIAEPLDSLFSLVPPPPRLPASVALDKWYTHCSARETSWEVFDETDTWAALMTPLDAENGQHSRTPANELKLDKGGYNEGSEK